MKIQTKLVLSILLASLGLVAALYYLLQWSVDRGVLSYVNQRQIERFAPVVEGLQAHYQQYQSWQAFAKDPREFGRLMARHDADVRERGAGPPGRRIDRPKPNRPDGLPPGNGMQGKEEGKEGGRDEGRHEGRNHRRGDGRRYEAPGPRQRGRRRPEQPNDVGLLDADKKPVIPSPRESVTMLPVNVNGVAQGWLVFRTADRLTNDYELDFLEQLQETVLLICLVVFTLALLIAYPLARHLTRPLAKLEQSTARLAAGDFSQRVDLQRTDEFGSLQRSFNELAATLEESDQSRKRWLADTSHELRTPLSIVRAQLGAMIDDVRPLSKQQLQVALTQIEHLQKLMDDLHELSNADIGGLRYSKQLIDLSSLINEAVEPHKASFTEQGISLAVYPPAQDIQLHADPSRLHQLLDNLLSNSLKYTNTGGRTRLGWTLDTSAGEAVISMKDSEPGVPSAELNQLFDYLYRAEGSRNRETGGSGLGLSISKRIVEAHHGSITAAASEYGGLHIEVRLPIAAGQK